MKKISFKLLALATIFATAGVMLAGTNDDDPTLKQISGYRQWTRVNQQPVVVPLMVNGSDSVAV